MYICICNAVSDAAVRQCVRDGAATLSDLKMQLGIASQCGKCAPAAQAIIDEEAANAGADLSFPSVLRVAA
jgi:bacterioferritin-associated ferredoxin